MSLRPSPVPENVHGVQDTSRDAQDRQDCYDDDDTIHPTASPPPDESVLRRAGWLQPRSYVSPASFRYSAQQGVIRASTVQLSSTDMPRIANSPTPVCPPAQYGPPPSSLAAHATVSQGLAEPSSEPSPSRSRDSFIFPTSSIQDGTPETMSRGTHHSVKYLHPLPSSFAPSSPHRGSPRLSLASEQEMDADEDLSASAYTFDSSPTGPSASTTVSGAFTPRGAPHTASALSILLSRKHEERQSQESLGDEQVTSGTTHERASATENPTSQTSVTSTNERSGNVYFSSVAVNAPHNLPVTGSHPATSAEELDSEFLQRLPDESTSLLHPNHVTFHPEDASNGARPMSAVAKSQSQHAKPLSDYGAITSFSKPTFRRVLDPNLGKNAIRAIPAVVLGILLNVLDGVSYGMIIFPAAGLFAKFGGSGVSMFFVSTIVAQLVYTFGGSNFAGANGSMMIEVVPFFHILASSIARDIIGDDWAGMSDMNHEVMATTLMAFALSSLLTGFTFFLLGYLRLGVLIGFFPRHILVGCIGGVGIFLILTGLSVSTRLPSDALDPPTWEVLQYLALDSHALEMWVPPLALAVLLRVINLRWNHQLLFPLYFLVIPIVFYIVVAAAQLDLGTLRREGWLFETAEEVGGAVESWYTFYTYFDLRAVHWTLIWTTLPTQFALLFFNILHPPLNVPALAISLDEDVDTDKELVGHGMSNIAAGLLCTVPNYLVYVNTLLFYRVGGGTRVASFMLAVATFLLLIIGTWPIAYIPVMVVGALISVLGIDLVKEALWDTRHRVSRMEYITIVSIMITMTVWDFVIGVLFGIVVSCFFFVIQNSQRRSIRTCYTGDVAISTVRRPAAHRAYIREVSKQTRIIQLQGFLFFGTISHVEDTIRSLVSGPTFYTYPVRFVVVDFSLVGGVDLSAAEAFVRVQRLLAAKGVVLVFCGVSRAELFETLNDAMEWTENAYLRAWFRAQKKETTPVAVLPGRQKVDVDFHETLFGSPRRLQLKDAGERTIAIELSTDVSAEPFHTLLKAFGSFDVIDHASLPALVPYFERVAFPADTVLWEKDDPPNGLYIIESGVLRASYKFAEHTPVIEESMVSGTLAGELSALSGLPRNARVVVERDAVLWRLSAESMKQLEEEMPHLAQRFVRLVLKAAKVDTDTLLAALATR
ncbi:sulfate transporter family-domain-containing protein [Chiua virens]|nr:sulfate transporter family-domain-containing protein [Chiua virens]